MIGKRKVPTYRRRIFLYFMAIAIVPLLVLGFYSYHSAVSAVRDSIRQSNETALLQVENRTENVLDAVRQDFLMIAGRSSTKEIIDQEYDDIPYPQIRSFIDEISGGESYINYADGYSFINYKKKWVLSNKGFNSMDVVANYEWLEELADAYQRIFWVNHIGNDEGENAIDSQYVDDQYLMYVVKMPTNTAHTDAVLVVNMKQSAMEDLFHDSLGNGSLLVMDQNGEMVYSENEAVYSYYKNHPEFLENMNETTIHTSEGVYDIVKRKASVSGWVYVAGYNSAAADSQFLEILFTMIGIIMIVLMVTGIISGFGSFFVYKPVKNLVNQVKSVIPEEEKEDEDEFNLIQEGIHSLLGHNEELKDVIDRQKNQVKELFAIRLVRGRIKEEEITRIKERLQMKFDSCLCVTSVIFCPLYETDRDQTGIDALNLELLNHLPEEIKKMLLFPPFIYTRAIVMIVDGKNRDETEQKLVALRNSLSSFIAEICGGYIDMGVSRIFEQETGFRRAYNESLEALKINEYSNRDENIEGISMEDSSVTYYGDLIGHSPGGSDYNLVLDAAIKEAIDSGDQKRAFAITNEFMKEVNKSGVVLYEQHYYFHRFLLAILSVPADAGIPIYDLFPEGDEDLFLQFNQLYDSRSIKMFYETKIIVPVINRMNQFRKSSSEMVMDKITELVEKNGGDLTLSECAEKVGCHPSYIWRVMKNTKDMTFTDYVAGQKLEMAKRMLVETDLSVAEIAERLSYSNAQNFIRLFKKHMDITPGQYRKQYK